MNTLRILITIQEAIEIGSFSVSDEVYKVEIQDITSLEFNDVVKTYVPHFKVKTF